MYNNFVTIKVISVAGKYCIELKTSLQKISETPWRKALDLAETMNHLRVYID